MFKFRRDIALTLVGVSLPFFMASGVCFANTSAAQLRREISTKQNGRVYCAEYDEDIGNPMVSQHNDLVNSITSYAPGHKAAEIVGILGEPRIIEKNLPLEEWPKSARDAQEVWLYKVGTPGWGARLALCFSNGSCTDVIRLSYDQQSAYDKWKTDQISSYASGKESDDIIKRFGKPDFRAKEKALRPVKHGSETVNVDETFDYCILDGQGVRLGFSKGKCVDTDCFSNSQ